MNTATQAKQCAFNPCSTSFLPVRPQQRFCSDSCRSAHHRENPNPLERENDFSLTLANPNPSFKTRKDGDHYFVEFELTKEEWEHFVDPNINRQGLIIEAQCMVAHSNKVLCVTENQFGLASKGGPITKGGPLAKSAGILCDNNDLRQFVLYKLAQSGIRASTPINAESAAQYIRDYCQIDSRAELDHSPTAGSLFAKLMAEYRQWLDGRKA